MQPVSISLPHWYDSEHAALPTHIPSIDARMAAVIRFSRLNIEHKTGGPFAAGIFERDSGKLIVIGVNRVVPLNCSSAHAEIVALMHAQQILGTFDLGGPQMPVMQMVVNWRPCAMCFGALPWSGVREVVLAGSGSELEQITGFDEGPVHPEWEVELRKRGINVINDVLGNEACEVFRQFSKSGSLVYNGRLGDGE